MKSWLIIGFLLMSFAAYAQQTNGKAVHDPPLPSLYIRYPKEAAQNNIQGVVKLQIEYDSCTITRITIIEGLGYGCNQEAIRFIKQQEGRRMHYTFLEKVKIVSIKFEMLDQ
ncbi:energy transducer TonB [Cytophagaceae bacterium DM2B3-1]|uniref:Energy transducer TonB n=1 Tax=Xanthocytophaga flava TaxID=3048013 RepID=A0ABT7CDZ8_9BACT|nr:energy transducer TonB [Xanthocytophaga flavus]MDJ1491913.1 energy transducer TonB [Xanthocytophaga flavus]